MSKSEKPSIAIPTPDETAAFAPNAEAASQDAPAAAEAPTPEQELARTRDKLLRAQAEIVNVTRRLTEERGQAIRNANASFARDLLTVMDNFERLLASLQDRPESDPVAHGARLIHEMLLKILKSHGVEPIETVGRPFDPRFHEALVQRPSTTVPEGHIIQEMVKGYRMHDRVLRAAVVAVARRPEGKADASAAEHAGER
jgi:molecular chaperone GrpE